MKNLPHEHHDTHNALSLSKALLSQDTFSAVAEVFKLLSDTSRARIYWLLCHCEECVFNISALLEMSSPAVCHHLRQLKDGGLIQSRREGKEVYYRACDTEVSKLLHMTLEKIMEISCPEDIKAENRRCLKDHSCTEEQMMMINSVHEYLISNLDKRITIEDAAKKFLMNTTTLKELFKTVYGTSIAAHIKTHRMEKAAEMLHTSDMSISDIAHLVGYENAGKFSAVFKQSYACSPKEYRNGGK